MDSSKLSALLLLLMLSISSTPAALACGDGCYTPTPKTPKSPPKTPKTPPIIPPIIGKPPITIPPIIGKPPITIPPIIGKPPITVPPIIGKPPITIPPIIGKPPITVPPIIGKPPITVPPIIGKPPITVPPITLPPVIGGGTPPSTGTPGCPPPPAKEEKCPVDVLKLGACLDILGSTINIGDPAVKCCPLIGGLSSVAAAACLCTTIKGMLLDINVFLPIALELLVTCGNSAPPGYTCT